MTARVLMYSTGTCPYCQMADRLLKAKGVENIEIIRIDLDAAQRKDMMQKTGRRTVPQIYIGEQHIGGFDELNALDRQGKLDALLQGA
ncbi:MAG: glutaredoxin 3 [Herbaspirillum sp.]